MTYTKKRIRQVCEKDTTNRLFAIFHTNNMAAATPALILRRGMISETLLILAQARMPGKSN